MYTHFRNGKGLPNWETMDKQPLLTQEVPDRNFCPEISTLKVDFLPWVRSKAPSPKNSSQFIAQGSRLEKLSETAWVKADWEVRAGEG